MSKYGQRAYAHARWEQRRLAAESAKKEKPPLTAEMARAAAGYVVETDINKAAELTGLSNKVLTNIANGRFTARGEGQIDNIIDAATAMGWQPK